MDCVHRMRRTGLSKSIGRWITGNRLKQNNDNLVDRFVSDQITTESWQSCNEDLDHVKNLRVYTDATLSMLKHTDHISHLAYIEIRRISSVCHLLTTKATAQLLCSLVFSWLDYCNSLFIDINCDQMYRLQKVQNHAANVVFLNSRYEHVRPLLKALHWLPVKERIIFKIGTFVFCFFDGTLPPYLSPCLSVYIPSHTLHSSSDEKNLYCARWKLKGFGYWSFSVQAPPVWNNLSALSYSKPFTCTGCCT